MPIYLTITAVIATIWVLAYFRATIFVWTLGIALAIAYCAWSGNVNLADQSIVISAFLVFALFANVPLFRRLITTPVLSLFRRILPPMSRTEREAIEAGSIWWDAELFSGRPAWNKLLKYDYPSLNAQEQAFLDGPVEQLCKMIDDYKINHEDMDLSPEVWQFIKQNKFFGMIIPKEYGGLAFTALGHSSVVMKIASRSIASAVTVMVPNSLGPAELLLHYGTKEQKDYYLPRLATGLEVPCFALTSPEAGSDASSIPDYGIVCRGDFDGQKNVLGMRVTWDKRYITLGPVATLLGLAIKLYDPEHLLGSAEEPGITCVLIPTKHPGVNIGRRHNPLNIAFQNGPNSGKDVFIPIDWIIGGAQQAGQGWRMLMECLAAGRAISLPALSVGGAKYSGRTMGAYGRVRKQFKTPIGMFEGIEEPLARIAGYTYMMDAARVLSCGALDAGEKPSVISAILKFNLTERLRRAVNDAMDIHGGGGICLGPRNLLGKIYQSIPISITVEGANILTRSLIIYGQGAIRCHPYILKEMQAAQDKDRKRAARDFDHAFVNHILFVISNAARALFMGLTGARLAPSVTGGAAGRYFQHVTRLCSVFALTSDVAMLYFGGALKRKEKISARLGDVLSALYLLSATLKHFESQGRRTDELPLLHWACNDLLFLAQDAIYGILANFPNRMLATILKFLCFPWGRTFKPASDHQGHQAAHLLLSKSDVRDRLTRGIFIPTDTQEPLGRLEAAMGMVNEVDVIDKKIHLARKEKRIQGYDIASVVAAALHNKVITQAEYDFWQKYEKLRLEVIRVDDFDAKLHNPG
ncbi:MAG: acyl-CoA dehydrogenase [Pseudomonadota bacterium]